MSTKRLSNRAGNAPKVNTDRDTPYASFHQLDGSHPWREEVPDSWILYPVRQLPKGKVSYFNFALAKEMGLIPTDHPHRLNKELKEKILETFNLRIINEYDQQHNVRFHPKLVKEKPYMATRYLQLQHKDKTGKTSGDGRCIWNGVVQHDGKTWDVSSRGTGVTALAPGAVEAEEPLQSGNTDFGYGCGLAEIDELYSSAIMAEIFHLNGINTERMLAIVDLGDDVGIGVRAAPNLLRPAHMFMHLKQENYEALQKSTDYFIDRQYKNGDWKFSAKHPERYSLMMNELVESFAQFTAHLERDYVFAWLDWDGDNVLGTAGIIDYGSVRQFGIRHDQYRYDDVERFSTNLNEQRAKSRLMLQVFVQMVDYLNSKNKKPLANFKNSHYLKKYDRDYDYYTLDRFLYQVGFDRVQREQALKGHLPTVQTLYKEFSYFERKKTARKLEEVADGVNRPPIFNMRKFLQEFPIFLSEHIATFDETLMDAREFFQMILSEHAGRSDSRMTHYIEQRIYELQESYKNLISRCAGQSSPKKLIEQISGRSDIINREDRITGNALLNIVSEILKQRRQGLKDSEVQKAMDSLILDQCLEPDRIDFHQAPKLHRSRRSRQLMETMLILVDGYKEDI